RLLLQAALADGAGLLERRQRVVVRAALALADAEVVVRQRQGALRRRVVRPAVGEALADGGGPPERLERVARPAGPAGHRAEDGLHVGQARQHEAVVGAGLQQVVEEAARLLQRRPRLRRTAEGVEDDG